MQSLQTHDGSESVSTLTAHSCILCPSKQWGRSHPPPPRQGLLRMGMLRRGEASFLAGRQNKAQVVWVDCGPTATGRCRRIEETPARLLG